MKKNMIRVAPNPELICLMTFNRFIDSSMCGGVVDWYRKDRLCSKGSAGDQIAVHSRVITSL